MEKKASPALPVPGFETAGEETLEIIAGYKVHPLASKFPLIVGKAFDEMVDAAAEARRLYPVETHKGLLIDGRNRLRVQEELRRRGIEIELPVVEWEPSGDETVAGHIWAVNAHRRHMTVDQLAALAASTFLPAIKAEREARQLASRFGKNSEGTAASVSTPPDGQVAEHRRTSAEKDAASSAGCLAQLANVSLYKARQAVALSKAVSKGEVPESAIDAVVAGDQRLVDAVPRRKAGAGKRPRPQACAEGKDMELPIDAAPVACEAEVRRRWAEQKAAFAIADHRELRRLYIHVVREEQRLFDQ
jgi:hypothetical protein